MVLAQKEGLEMINVNRILRDHADTCKFIHIVDNKGNVLKYENISEIPRKVKSRKIKDWDIYDPVISEVADYRTLEINIGKPVA